MRNILWFQSVRSKNGSSHPTILVTVFLVAGLLVANLAIGLAWAKEDKEKGQDKKQDKEAKESKGKSENQEKRGNSDKQERQGQDKGGGKADDSPKDGASSTGSSGDNSNQGNHGQAQTPQQPAQDLPEQPSAQIERAVSDRLATTDIFDTLIGFGRSASDSINLDDVQQSELRAPVQAPVESEMQMTVELPADTVSVSTPPEITITSSELLYVSADRGAEITFDSTTAGTYAVAIKSDDSDATQTIFGRMQAGANYVMWEGRDSSGSAVPDGTYTYFIMAENAGGAREPPSDGDGKIIVTISPVLASIDMGLLMIALTVVAASAALLFFILRKRSITIFLPVEAKAVVDDITDRYPRASVADYIETEEGCGKRYIGITIPKGADNEWLEEIATRTKEIAKVDSVSLRYRGRTQIL